MGRNLIKFGLVTACLAFIGCAKGGLKGKGAAGVNNNAGVGPVPLVQLSAMNADGQSVEVASGGSLILRWTTENTTSCRLNSGNQTYSTMTQNPAGLSVGPINTSQVFVLDCEGPGGRGSDFISVNVQNTSGSVRPEVNLYGNGMDTPPAIPAGQGIALQWISANATSCQVGILNGAVLSTSLNNTAGLLSPPLEQSTVFVMACTGAGGSSSDFLFVPVQARPNPGVNITADNQEGPLTVASGSTVRLRWTSVQVVSCEVRRGNGTLFDITLNQTAGLPSDVLTASETYTIRCAQANGSIVSDSVRIDLSPVPQVDLKVNGSDGPIEVPFGSTVNLSWITSGATSCSLKLGSATLSTATSNTGLVSPKMQDSGAYILSCTNTNGTSSNTVQVNMSAPTDHLIFVTSTGSTGNLGGIAAADQKCQSLAVAANLRGGRTWRAVLSTDTVNVKDRMMVTLPVRNVRGDTIVADGTQIWAGTNYPNIANPVRYTEQNVDVSDTDDVWSGTKSGGLLDSGETCKNWTYSGSGDNALVGSSSRTGLNWIRDTIRLCHHSLRLYCISF